MITMLRKQLAVLGLLLVAALAAACSQHATRGSSVSGAESSPASEYPPPPPESPLAKIKPGMGTKEVTDLIGPPTDSVPYVTGKAFIPFYFGEDRARIEWRYKGMGRVIFAAGGGFGGGSSVQWVEYDPSEPGYYRR